MAQLGLIRKAPFARPSGSQEAGTGSTDICQPPRTAESGLLGLPLCDIQTPLRIPEPFQLRSNHGLPRHERWQRLQRTQRQAQILPRSRIRLPQACMGKTFITYGMGFGARGATVPCHLANFLKIQPCAQTLEIGLLQTPKLQEALLLNISRLRQQPLLLGRCTDQSSQCRYITLTRACLYLKIDPNGYRRLGTCEPCPTVG